MSLLLYKFGKLILPEFDIWTNKGSFQDCFPFSVTDSLRNFLYFLFFFSEQVLFHYDPCSLMLKLILTTKKAFGKNFCLSHEHERAF